MTWLPSVPEEKTHHCRLPWLLFRRVGRRWLCDECGRVWRIEDFDSFWESWREWMPEDEEAAP